MKKDEDHEQPFKNLAEAVEQTVEDVRGAEENYFRILQRTMACFPRPGGRG